MTENAPSNASAPAGEGNDALVWETSLGLVTNPLVRRQLILVVVLSGMIMALLLSFLMAVTGDFDAIPTMLLISLLAMAVLAALMLLVIFLFFNNRMRVRFTLDERGVLWETVDRRARAASRLATLAGALGGSPQTAGAGMIGMSREAERVDWDDVDNAVYGPRSRSITLRNSWRPIMLVACTAENYDAVAAMIGRRIGSPATARERPAGKRVNPLPGLLLRTLAIILAATPAFILPYPFELDIFVPLLLLLFALATLWLVPLFGWVVIGCALIILGQIVFIGLEVKESIFAWRGTYRNFEILSGDDWLFLALALAGLAYLTWFSLRALRGKVRSALMAD